MLYSDASGVEHTDSGPHNSGNKSSGRVNRRPPYSKPPDAFMCGERPKKHLLLNASCRLLSMEVGPLCSDDYRVRAWRHRGKRLNLPLLYSDDRSRSWCDVLGCHCLQYAVSPSIDPWHRDSPALCPWHPATTCVSNHAMAPRSHFQQDNAQPHTTRVSQDCLCSVTILPWTGRSPALSPIVYIWDHLGRGVGHPTSLNELEQCFSKFQYLRSNIQS
ncbi:uncharacterized protein TNCV_2551821 [Trichonephila clavipes]|nr:uncharacterized protein TNCV_2551821 [Trichonephila clavipes]